jgi:hypothetical protein
MPVGSDCHTSIRLSSVVGGAYPHRTVSIMERMIEGSGTGGLGSLHDEAVQSGGVSATTGAGCSGGAPVDRAVFVAPGFLLAAGPHTPAGCARMRPAGARALERRARVAKVGNAPHADTIRRPWPNSQVPESGIRLFVPSSTMPGSRGVAALMRVERRANPAVAFAVGRTRRPRGRAVAAGRPGSRGRCARSA